MHGSYGHVKEILALHERGLSHTCSDCNIKNTKPFPNVRRRLFCINRLQKFVEYPTIRNIKSTVIIA